MSSSTAALAGIANPIKLPLTIDATTLRIPIDRITFRINITKVLAPQVQTLEEIVAYPSSEHA
ncbi:hypothetical protein NIES2104_60140 [Leptolyngbya sp. NIES-2104]|nr:hypothetical protein NIES2104_60140 [Leptolyngbya sp. NIES-2104]